MSQIIFKALQNGPRLKGLVAVRTLTSRSAEAYYDDDQKAMQKTLLKIIDDDINPYLTFLNFDLFSHFVPRIFIGFPIFLRSIGLVVRAVPCRAKGPGIDPCCHQMCFLFLAGK